MKKKAKKTTKTTPRKRTPTERVRGKVLELEQLIGGLQVAVFNAKTRVEQLAMVERCCWVTIEGLVLEPQPREPLAEPDRLGFGHVADPLSHPADEPAEDWMFQPSPYPRVPHRMQRLAPSPARPPVARWFGWTQMAKLAPDGSATLRFDPQRRMRICKVTAVGAGYITDVRVGRETALQGTAYAGMTVVGIDRVSDLGACVLVDLRAVTA